MKIEERNTLISIKENEFKRYRISFADGEGKEKNDIFAYKMNFQITNRTEVVEVGTFALQFNLVNI